MIALFHGETGTHCLGIQIKAAWSCFTLCQPATLLATDLMLPFPHNARLSPGWGGAVQERNIKQEKLVFPPEIRLPASKLNRLQRGGLFVLLHQAWLLHGGVSLKEHGAG